MRRNQVAVTSNTVVATNVVVRVVVRDVLQRGIWQPLCASISALAKGRPSKHASKHMHGSAWAGREAAYAAAAFRERNAALSFGVAAHLGMSPAIRFVESLS